MPVKPLSLRLVQRLRQIMQKEAERANEFQRESRVHKILGQMENVDHRRNFPDLVFTPDQSTNVSGRRVRQINVLRAFPREHRRGVVLKRVHDFTAKETIERLARIVKSHNARFTPSNYVLLMPHAYEIGVDLIAMAKTSNPSVEEILSKSGSQTKRGHDFFKKLNAKFEITENGLHAAAETVRKRTGIFFGDLLFLGYKNNKFIFMPLVGIEKGTHDEYFR